MFCMFNEQTARLQVNTLGKTTRHAQALSAQTKALLHAHTCDDNW